MSEKPEDLRPQDAVTMAIAIGKTQQSVETMAKAVDSMATQVGHMYGAVNLLAKQYEEVKLIVDQHSDEIEGLRLAGTRPRQNTLSEIEGAPRVGASINAIEHTTKAARNENRWLTAFIGLCFAIYAVANMFHH